jgi:hypothetical protein
MALIVRAKMAAALRHARLLHHVPPAVWAKPWVVQCQHAGTGDKVLEYLARYVFRVAITNSRIEAIEEDGVTFRYRDRTRGTVRHCTLPPLVFLARFLQHVLPMGFAKVRSYGLLAPRNRAQLDAVHAQLATTPPPATLSPAHSPARAPADASPPPPHRCPVCRVGIMRLVRTLPRHRGPP